MYSSNRNNKTFMIIGIITIFFIVALIIVGIILYLKTDIFRSDEELFQRQFLQNIDVINNIVDISIENDYRKLLEENSFNENTKLNLKYMDSEGKEDNFIGNVKGIKNNQSNKSFKDIKVDFGTTNVMNMTYLNENEIHGIRFLDGTKFAVIDMSNDITAVLKYFQIDNIINTDKINIVKLGDIISLSNEEIKQLEQRYLSIILQNITEKNYSSQKERMITLSNNQSVITNSYILKLDAQQVKIIYEEILNQLLNDEIIQGKLENIDNKIKEMGINTNKNIKTLYTEIINEKKRNIEVESGVVVTIYELDGNTVRTTLEYGNIIIEIDVNNISDINIRYSDIVLENIQDAIISIKKDNGSLQINYEGFDNKKIELIRKLSVNNNDINSGISIKYADNDKIKGLEFSIDRNIKLGTAEQIPTSFEKTGKVLLNDYDEKSTSNNLEALKNRIVKLLREKRDETESVLLDYLIQYNNQLEENEKTEEENKRKRFNSKFELYEGENLDESIVLNMLDEAGKNMTNYQVIGNNLIKIYIEEGKENIELATEIKNRLNQEEDKSYNIKIGYDSNAKINQIIIELFEPEEGQ